MPDFSLQRKQPDYAIPLDERADVVNALVPGAETMARDIGLELKLTITKPVHSASDSLTETAQTMFQMKEIFFI